MTSKSFPFNTRFEVSESTISVGGGEKGYQNGGEVVPCQASRSE